MLLCVSHLNVHNTYQARGDSESVDYCIWEIIASYFEPIGVKDFELEQWAWIGVNPRQPKGRYVNIITPLGNQNHCKSIGLTLGCNHGEVDNSQPLPSAQTPKNTRIWQRLEYVLKIR